MTLEEHTEIQRKAHAAQLLKENEIFSTMFRDMEMALLQQMKRIVPEDPRFVQYGHHLHALGDIERYIESYIEDGMMADQFLESMSSLN